MINPEKFEPKRIEPARLTQEKALGQNPEIREKPIDRLKREVREMALGLQKEGVPVDNGDRIDIRKFSDVYSRQTIEADGAWGKDFIVVRTSEYDDAKYKVDNIILNRRTGHIICAFDEIGAATGERFEEKKEQIREIRERPVHPKLGKRLDFFEAVLEKL